MKILLVMHDLCEGVHRYDMCVIIQKLRDSKYFTLKTLNARIKFLTYLKTEKNCPPSINYKATFTKWPNNFFSFRNVMSRSEL